MYNNAARTLAVVTCPVRNSPVRLSKLDSCGRSSRLGFTIKRLENKSSVGNAKEVQTIHALWTVFAFRCLQSRLLCFALRAVSFAVLSSRKAPTVLQYDKRQNATVMPRVSITGDEPVRVLLWIVALRP